VRSNAVASGHGAGGEKGVQYRPLGRLRRGVGERGNTLVGDRGEGHGQRGFGEAEPGQTAVAGGEGEEDVAAGASSEPWWSGPRGASFL
jgi:hypothetical protein